jgi:hypothetical protein
VGSGAGAGLRRGELGAPGRIRTCNLRIRRPLLYPLSYGRPVLVGTGRQSSLAFAR